MAGKNAKGKKKKGGNHNRNNNNNNSNTSTSLTLTGASASQGGSDEETLEVIKPWAEQARDEIAKGEGIISDKWIAVTLAKAQWMHFSVDPKIKAAFDTPVGNDKDQVLAWVRHAESSIVQWVLRERILKDNHVEEFRRLGRGWIFVWLRRPKKEFKFWFESVKRIEHDHQMDLRALNLHGEKLNKHTYGYLFQSEMVFFIKGLVNGTGTQPTISIQKLHPGFRDLAKWATNTEVMEACKKEELATDEERKIIAAKTMKRHKRNQRLKVLREEQQQAAAAEAATRLLRATSDSTIVSVEKSNSGDSPTGTRDVLPAVNSNGLVYDQTPFVRWCSEYTRLSEQEEKTLGDNNSDSNSNSKEAQRNTKEIARSWFRCSKHFTATQDEVRAPICSCAEPNIYASVAHILEFEYPVTISAMPTSRAVIPEGEPLSDFERLLQQFKNEDVKRDVGRRASGTGSAGGAGQPLNAESFEDGDDMWRFDDDDDDDDEEEIVYKRSVSELSKGDGSVAVGYS